jgi:STELLO glycosyltransferases
MSAAVAVVVTTIHSPNHALREIARGCLDRGFRFIVVGDTKTPPGFRLEGCEYYDVEAQIASGLHFARLCPTRHYARKNVGYLLAMASAGIIVETDDDNLPRPGFFAHRQRSPTAALVEGAGWVNAYRYFTDSPIWPRGLPLDVVNVPPPPRETLSILPVDCPIQQGLADGNPDVDAVYRLVLPLPHSFRAAANVALGRGSLCPFNSQNTTWWRAAFPLLYLPAFCSFRMTDIWRSFVAQRVAWENGWSILFHEATVTQERNEHDLMADFSDEVPGYLRNAEIGRALRDLELRPGVAEMGANMRRCYEALVALRVVQPAELELFEAWLDDVQGVQARAVPEVLAPSGVTPS